MTPLNFCPVLYAKRMIYYHMLLSTVALLDTNLSLICLQTYCLLVYNFTNKLLNCFVVEHSLFETKQLRSLLLKSLLHNLFVEIPGFNCCFICASHESSIIKKLIVSWSGRNQVNKSWYVIHGLELTQNMIYRQLYWKTATYFGALLRCNLAK